MTRPLLLLDVDGVLNPFGAPRCPSGFTEHALFPGEEPVRINPGHGTWITELLDVYDVAWATFWNENANRLLAPLLGIAPLPIVTMPSAPCHPSAKVPLIAEFCRHRPAVWIDDAHTPEASTWSRNRTEPTLLIAIDPATGLTRRSVDQALTWVDSPLGHAHLNCLGRYSIAPSAPSEGLRDLGDVPAVPDSGAPEGGEGA